MKVEPALKAPRRRVEVESIARRLPSLLPSAARAARVGFDRRFQVWLSQVAGLEGAQVYPRRPPTDLLSLDIRCAHGSVDVALDPAQWPALQMATGLPDAELARDVTDALLMPLVQHLAPLLPGAQVRAVRRYPSQAVATCTLPCVSASRRPNSPPGGRSARWRLMRMGRSVFMRSVLAAISWFDASMMQRVER